MHETFSLNTEMLENYNSSGGTDEFTEINTESSVRIKCSTLSLRKPISYEGTEKKKVRNLQRFLTQYPDRESNSELSFRRALLYPFNYQGMS